MSSRHCALSSLLLGGGGTSKAPGGREEKSGREMPRMLRMQGGGGHVDVDCGGRGVRLVKREDRRGSCS